MDKTLDFIGCLRLDHIGWVVNDINSAINSFMTLSQCYVPQEIIHVTSQNIFCCYLEPKGIGTKIQLIQPVTINSPICKFLNKNGPCVNHLCFSVKDIKQSIELSKNFRFKTIVYPFHGEGVQNRLAAFVYNRDIGLVELVEDV